MFLAAQQNIFLCEMAFKCGFGLCHLLIFDKFCGQGFAFGIGLPYIGLE